VVAFKREEIRPQSCQKRTENRVFGFLGLCNWKVFGLQAKHYLERLGFVLQKEMYQHVAANGSGMNWD
jgi:hypothetical protein